MVSRQPFRIRQVGPVFSPLSGRARLGFLCLNTSLRFQILERIYTGSMAKPVRKEPPLGSKLRRFLDSLRSYEPERIYLFGSWARGEQDDLSDLDIVVIKRTSLPFLERLREVAKYFPPKSGGVDVLVYTPEEFEAMRRDGNAFAEMIVEEGLLVYGDQAEG